MIRSSQNSSLPDEDQVIHPLVTDPRLLPLNGLGNWLGHLKVGQKITLGYAFVLGAAMLGTALGFMIADRQQQAALYEEEDAIEELYQVHQLKSAVFRVRTQQHKLILDMERPDRWRERYPQLVQSVANVRQEWIEFEATFRSPSRRLKDTPQEKVAYAQLMDTRSDFDNYLNQSEILFRASNPEKLAPIAIDSTQSQLFNFMHNPEVFTLDEFLDDIEHVVEVTAAEYNHAKTDSRDAERLRFRIIVVSLLLSTAIATVLVIYINRAIARPIQMVTHVAQQVTEDANFDLQAPVTTRDEIGILATSLNRLIHEVQQLLKTQNETNEQLEIYSQILEKKVRERTRELKEKNQSLERALAELHRTQAQLVHTEKMSSVKQIVAEVVGAIDSPLHSLGDDLGNLTQDIQSLLGLIALYQHAAEPHLSVQAKISSVDLESLQQSLPDLLKSMQTATEKITGIVSSLQCFSQSDQLEAVDIQQRTDALG